MKSTIYTLSNIGSVVVFIALMLNIIIVPATLKSLMPFYACAIVIFGASKYKIRKKQ